MILVGLPPWSLTIVRLQRFAVQSLQALVACNPVNCVAGTDSVPARDCSAILLLDGFNRYPEYVAFGINMQEEAQVVTSVSDRGYFIESGLASQASCFVNRHSGSYPEHAGPAVHGRDLSDLPVKAISDCNIQRVEDPLVPFQTWFFHALDPIDLPVISRGIQFYPENLYLV